MSEQIEALTKAIRSVTDLWDDPLDEVHDIPPIVNAIIASRWTPDQHYAKGVADGLGQCYEYLLRHGSSDMGDWLKRRESGFMALLPTDAHGNIQFQPEREATR